MSINLYPALNRDYLSLRSADRDLVRKRPRKRQAPSPPHTPNSVSSPHADGGRITGLRGASICLQRNSVFVEVPESNVRQQQGSNTEEYRAVPRINRRAHVAGKRPAPSPPVQETGWSTPASPISVHENVRWSTQHRRIRTSVNQSQYGYVSSCESGPSSPRAKPWFVHSSNYTFKLKFILNH